MVDPARFTQRYDRRLVAALRRQGTPVTLLWAPAVHGNGPRAEALTGEVAFASSLGQTPWRQIVRRSAWLRRALRGLHYPLDHAGLIDRVRATSQGLVHLQWALAPWMDSWIVKVLRRDVPVVLTAHNVLPHEARPWHPAAYRRLYAAVDAVVVHSQAARERLASLCPAADVTVLPMPAGGWQAAADAQAAEAPGAVAEGAVAGGAETAGAETAWAALAQTAEAQAGAAGTPSEAARARLRLPATGPIVLFFGLRRPYKGLPVLLDAWDRLGPRVPSAHLVVAGPGSAVELLAATGADGSRVSAGPQAADRSEGRSRRALRTGRGGEIRRPHACRLL